MAKGNLFLSQARGKVGSVVFYRKDGEQVSRVYTSQVKNPKSSAQNLQRAIFYSVSRMAAGAKYLVEQGQEGVATGAKSRQAFVKKALNDLRTRVLAGDASVLNVKGNPYMQPIPVSLTNGSLPTVDYRFDGSSEGSKYHFKFGMSEGMDNIATQYTLRQFFAEHPALGLNKQMTFVFLVSEKDLSDDATPDIAGLNYRTKLMYDEIVFASDPAVLDLPAFAFIDGTMRFNPEVLAPSWGGNCDVDFEQPSAWQDEGVGTETYGFEAYPDEDRYEIIAGAIIVSDYTNNKWSRSYSPFAVCPMIAQDANLIAATYEAAASTTNGEEYLDQATAGDGTEIHSEWAPKGVVVADADNSYEMTKVLAMTRSWTPNENVIVEVGYNTQIGGNEGIPVGSILNVAVGGTYKSLTPAYRHTQKTATCVLTLGSTAPTNGQTTELQITTADGIVRRFTIKWVVA